MQMFMWSSQRGLCFLGRMYDGSKFRFRNYGVARSLVREKVEKRSKKELNKQRKRLAGIISGKELLNDIKELTELMKHNSD